MKNPSLAPSVLNDPELKWLCKNCQYHRECDEEEKAKDTAEKAEYEERIVVEKAMVDSTLDEAEDQ